MASLNHCHRIPLNRGNSETFRKLLSILLPHEIEIRPREVLVGVYFGDVYFGDVYFGDLKTS